jgi:peptidoglycan/xylan/chitin deacetylase (PgdA/CDA1 family)
LVLLVPAVAGDRARTTEHLEYTWLRSALQELPDGCRVAWVDRAGRRVLTIPEHLVPGWSCGTTSGIPVRTPADLTLGLLPGACRAYYRSSLCSSPEGAVACAAAEQGVVLEELARTALPAVPTYADLAYSVDPVEVALFRVSVPPAAPPLPLAGVRIAVTVDDLPWVGYTPLIGRVEATKALLQALDGVPATGFVNCARVTAEQSILRLWEAAGKPLGNHQQTHDDLNEVGLDPWLAGARRCHERLTEWLGQPPTMFRYPYLRNGNDAAVRDAAVTALTQELGQTIARVTADNHEWKYAQLYGEARAAGDDERGAALAEAYVTHIVEAVAHAAEFARSKTGRDIDHILLLHANALNADHLHRVVEALRGQGVTFLSLEEAVADPIYARPDAYVAPGGISWMYRIAPVTPSSEWTFEEESWKELERLFGAKP